MLQDEVQEQCRVIEELEANYEASRQRCDELAHEAQAQRKELRLADDNLHVERSVNAEKSHLIEKCEATIDECKRQLDAVEAEKAKLEAESVQLSVALMEVPTTGVRLG